MRAVYVSLINNKAFVYCNKSYERECALHNICIYIPYVQ